MDSITELRLLTPRPVALAEPGYRTAKANTVTAEPKSVAAARPAAPASAARTAEAAVQAAEATPNAKPSSAQIHRRFARFETMDYADGIPDRDFEFGDLLDVINPLQHIPVVGSLYRNLTGDQISGPAKIMGGLLYGGPVGFVAALATTIAEQEVGQDLGEAALAALFDGEETGDVLLAEQPADAVSAAIPTVTPAAANIAVANAAAANTTAGVGSQAALSGQDALDAFVRDFKGARHSSPVGGRSDGAAIEVVPLAPLPSIQAQRAANPQLAQNARIGAIEPGPLGWTIQRRAEPAVAVLARSADAAPAEPLADPLAQAAEISGRTFSERMLRALDKYQAMSRAKDAEQPAAELDVRL
jgi:hypothetical protein